MSVEKVALGKSFLIKTIRQWIKQSIGKDTAVTAPTGIAAFNIEGLTIHRLFQLPVEHGHTAQYRQLSDAALQIVRDQLKNVALVVIDEISMVSNVTFLYIHLRLTEIFDTADSDDAWFGKIPILLFGDLLQLPPVHEEPAFIQLSDKSMEKNVGGVGAGKKGKPRCRDSNPGRPRAGQPPNRFTHGDFPWSLSPELLLNRRHLWASLAP